MAKWETFSTPMLFGDPGLEKCLNAVALGARNIIKSIVFEMVSLFPLVHEIGNPRGGFRCHLAWFCCPWAHFFWFLSLKFDDFAGMPWGATG